MLMPFLIRYPKMIKPGSVNKDLCINVDIAPTLLDLAGVKAPKAMQGRSMKPLLENKTPSNWRQSQFYTYWGAPPHYGIRTKRYTYFKIANHPAELFDRKADPHQRHNVAAKPEHKDTIKQLETELQKQIREVEINDSQLPGKANRKEKKRKG